MSAPAGGRVTEEGDEYTAVGIFVSVTVAKMLVDKLAQSAPLRKLTLRSCRLDLESVETLVQELQYNTTLEFLSLDSSGIRDRSVQLLALALETNSALKHLDLANSMIGDKGMAAIAGGLERNHTLQALILPFNDIGDEGVAVLAAALEVNSSLTRINYVLVGNGISAEGARSLADALKVNASVRSLHLGQNKVGDEGASALAETLQSNRSLRDLGLGSNGISDDGAEALAAPLATNSTLRNLSLSCGLQSGQRIHDIGAMALARALETNTALDHLDLRGNRIAMDGATAIAAAMDSNTSLRRLILMDNLVPAETYARISSALRRNTSTPRSTRNAADGLVPARAKVMVLGDCARARASTVQALLGDAAVAAAPKSGRSTTTSSRKSLSRRLSTAARASLRRLSRASSGSSSGARIEEEDAEALSQAQDADFHVRTLDGSQVHDALHSIVLAGRDICLLVFDARQVADPTQAVEAAGQLREWLAYTRLCAPEAAVVLVGSFADQVDDLDQVNQVLENQLGDAELDRLTMAEDGHLFLALKTERPDATHDLALRAAVAAAVEAQRGLPKHVPLAWDQVHGLLAKSKEALVGYDDIVEAAAKHGQSAQDVDSMLGYLHDLGAVVHAHGSRELERTVVLDPQWLVAKMGRLFAAREQQGPARVDEGQLAASGLLANYDRMLEQGVVSRALLSWLWSDEDEQMPEEAADYLVAFAEAEMLLCPWQFGPGAKPGENFLAPGLLAETDDAAARSSPGFAPGLTCVVDFSALMLPAGVYHRLVMQCVSRAAQLEASGAAAGSVAPELTSPRSAILSFGGNEFLLAAEGDRLRISISDEAEDPAMVFRQVVSIVRELEASLYRGLAWDLCLVGPESGVAASYATLAKKWEAGKLNAKVKDQHRSRATTVSEFAPFFAEDMGPLLDASEA